MLTRRQLTNRKAYSLLDTLAAGAVLAIVLVPAYSAMRQGLEWSRDVDAQKTTTTLCVAKMEEHLAVVASSFTSATDTGNFSTDGFANLKYSVVCSDSLASGGIPDQLMSISVTVFQDDDNDNSLDSGEISTTLTTNVAKMTTYTEL